MKIDDLLNKKHIVPEIRVRKFAPITARLNRKTLNNLIKKRAKVAKKK